MTPRKTVELWVQRFNAADLDGLAALYAESATNHQVTQEPVCGRTAIRDLFAREFAEPRCGEGGVSAIVGLIHSQQYNQL